MSTDTCPRLDDAASYVLRAMPDGEWESYRDHVTRCDACAGKVAELGFVSDALLNGVPQLSAPPAIRDRVMSVVRAESELLLAAGPEADRPAAAEQRKPRRLRLLRLRPWPATALATALLALGIGGGALLVAGDDPSARTVACAEAPDGASCRLRVADDSAQLVVGRMEAPPPGRIYQVWLAREGATKPEPTEALFSVRDGRATVDVPGDLSNVSQVLVTHEPLGGSDVPTRLPLIRARIA